MPSPTELQTKHGLYIGRRAGKLHVALYRRSRGRIGARIRGRGGVPIRMLLLHHRGVRSGIERTTPLIYVEDGADLVVTASRAGQPEHPAWFHNLMAAPETTVQVGAAVRAVRARVASDAERERLWPAFPAAFRGFEIYRRYAEAAGRTIPVVILEPR
jgi:deazaflavin-dependent oxidoreductase (nitroreductase family)